MVSKDVTNALPAIWAKGVLIAEYLGVIPFNPDL